MMQAGWRQTGLWFTVLSFCGLVAAPLASAAVTFTSVGDLGGGTSTAAGVSGDGTLVVGGSSDGANTQAYIWDGSIHALGFPGDVNYSTAVGVDIALDSSVKVAVNGRVDYAPYPSEVQAFLWSGTGAGAGAYDPAVILFDGVSSTAMDLTVQTGGETYICGYGQTAGWTSASNDHGFRWRSLPSMLDLGIPGLINGVQTAYPVHANSVSKLGQITGQMQYGGSGSPGSGARHAFWWESNNWIVLPTLVGPPTAANESSGRVISADGTAISGWSYPVSGYRQAFWWQRGSTTATEIPYLAGDDWNEGQAMNRDGQLVGGFSTKTGGGAKRAFIWDATNGTREMKQVLIDAGIDMTGWELEEVTGISEDGSVICGNGKLSGVSKGWVASGLPAFSPLPPVIAQPYPDSVPSGKVYVNINQEYKVQMTLTQGTIPSPAWSVVSISPTPAAAGSTPQINSSGLVFGWTPQAADLPNGPFTITVQATNVSGSSQISWDVYLLNEGPSLVTSLPLYPDTTSITVTNIAGASTTITQVTLYRNRYDSGTGTWNETVLQYADASSTPPLATDATTYTFTMNPGDLALGDVITATQHRMGVESNKQYRWRVVLPKFPVPQTPPTTWWGFSDDFELTYIKPFWQVDEAMTLVTNPSRGTRSVQEFAGIPGVYRSGGGRMAIDATPAISWGDRFPQLFDFWMYEDGDGYARHVCGLQVYSGNGYGAGSASYTAEAGLLPGWRDTRSNPSRGAADPTKYQYRLVAPTPSYRTGGVSGNMDEPGCPGRTPGWHRFSVKIAQNKMFWYVDGKLGHREIDTAPMINVMYVGTWSGNAGTEKVSSEPLIIVNLDEHTAYYDDVSLRQYTNRVPTASAAQTVAVSGGVAMAPVVATATDPDAAAGIAPDSASLQAFSLNVTGLNWTAATLQLSGTEKFAYYNFQPGDQINITAGTGVTPGWYTVASRDNNDTITLGSSIAAGDVIDGTIAGEIGAPPNPTTWVPTLTYVSGTPSGTVTISGTPPSAAIGETYVFLFEARDDLNNLAPGFLWERTKVTIVVTAGCNLYPQDQDNDNDVDLVDFGSFQACFNGPNRPWKGPPPPVNVCRCMDNDGDNDVDLVDFGKFQNCFNGPNRAPKAGCI